MATPAVSRKTRSFPSHFFMSIIFLYNKIYTKKLGMRPGIVKKQSVVEGQIELRLQDDSG